MSHLLGASRQSQGDDIKLSFKPCHMVVMMDDEDEDEDDDDDDDHNHPSSLF